jgi:hypothetical protein
MNAGLQHLTHGYGHASLHSGLCLHRRLAFPAFEPDTLKRRCAKWTARIAACPAAIPGFVPDVPRVNPQAR